MMVHRLNTGSPFLSVLTENNAIGDSFGQARVKSAMETSDIGSSLAFPLLGLLLSEGFGILLVEDVFARP